MAHMVRYSENFQLIPENEKHKFYTEAQTVQFSCYWYLYGQKV